MFQKRERMVKLFNSSKEKLNEKDVGLMEDLSFTIRNLLSWEDHLSRHIKKVSDEEKDKYLEILERVRGRRSLLMDFIVSTEVYAEWCMSKHGFSSSEGFIELANRFTSMKDKKRALRCFLESFECEDDVFLTNNISREKGESNSEA